jgi:hypothetical protein
MTVVTLVVPIFGVLALGYVLRKTAFIDGGFPGQLNRLVYYIALPALLFTKTAAVEPGELLRAPLLLGLPLVVGIMGLLAGLLAQLWLGRAQRGAFVQASFRANLAYLGLPIVISAYGDAAAGPAAVVVAVGTIINTVASIAVLRLFSQEDTRAASRLAAILRNPLVISIALGLVTAAIGVPLPGVVRDTLDLVARMSLPAILLVAGFSLSFRNIRANLSIAIVASTLKLIVMPAVAWLLVSLLFDVPPITVNVIVLMTAMPTAIIAQSFARSFDGDERMTAGVVSLDTLLAMVTVPVTIFFLQTISNI